jgi:hypothetical protein
MSALHTYRIRLFQKQLSPPRAAPDLFHDQINGREVFIVVGRDAQVSYSATICDEIVSRQAACEHAQLLCHPTAPRSSSPSNPLL